MAMIRMSAWPPQLLLLLFTVLLPLAARRAVAAADVDVLLKFKASLASGGADVAAALRSWSADARLCKVNDTTWAGVICENGYVLGLQLENMSLSGALNVDVLAGLPKLRTLSFMNNSFEGPMPDITKIPVLKSIYLSMNRFSGEIPDGFFAGFQRMKKVYLSQNQFSGRIPSSLTRLAWLIELRLDGNKFIGEIPDFRQPGLTLVNVSYNNLQGQIPAALSKKMDASLFQGNKNLCGPPLSVACESSSSGRRSPTVPVVLVILLSIAILILILGLLIFALMHRRRQREQEISMTRLESSKAENLENPEADKMQHVPAVHHGGSKKVPKEEQGKLTFVRENRNKFDLEDLLRASAEVLGSGNFGSSYKAILYDGPAVVVKRFKEMNGAGREDFQEHMRRLGRLSHPNLLPVVAYYYRKDEKLLVTEHVPNGSLAHMLHGNRGSILPPLDWAARLKIAKGVARGLAYLYEELPMLAAPHGHLKSSNVLLDLSFEPVLSDYALLPLMNRSRVAQVMIAYKSPECASNGKPSKKSDVWSLGILILEILTGKFPATYPGQDLVSWVNSVVKEEGTGEVLFDSNMKGSDNAEGEMLKLLHIGIACCEINVEKRLEMSVALEKIEALKERDGDHEHR